MAEEICSLADEASHSFLAFFMSFFFSSYLTGAAEEHLSSSLEK